MPEVRGIGLGRGAKVGVEIGEREPGRRESGIDGHRAPQRGERGIASSRVAQGNSELEVCGGESGLRGAQCLQRLQRRPVVTQRALAATEEERGRGLAGHDLQDFPRLLHGQRGITRQQSGRMLKRNGKAAHGVGAGSHGRGKALVAGIRHRI